MDRTSPPPQGIVRQPNTINGEDTDLIAWVAAVAKLAKARGRINTDVFGVVPSVELVPGASFVNHRFL